MANWSNPIGAGLSPERIDMGVDYGGTGPLYALGSGTVTNVYNSGWPGGTFLTIHLDDTGDYIYYAEDIEPLVSVGQKVTKGQHVANATGGSSGIEVGWAAAPGTGEALAGASGQAEKGESSSGDPGEYSTAYGVAMSNVIAALGGPAGTTNPPVQGTVPSSFLSQLSAAVGKTIEGVEAAATLTSDTTSSSGSSGIIGDIESLLGLGAATSFATDIGKLISGLMWIVTPGAWLRIGAFFVAIVLLIGAIIIFTKADTKLNVTPVPVPV